MRTRRIVMTFSALTAVTSLAWLYSCGSGSSNNSNGGSSGNPDGGVGSDGMPSTGSDSPSSSDSPSFSSDSPTSSSDSPASGGDTGPTGGDSGSDGGPDSSSGGPDGAVAASTSVLQHHKSAERDGLYTDPIVTKSYATGLTRDTGFNGSIIGNVLGQPLYVAGISAGKDAVFIATESDNIYSLDSVTGAQNWMKNVGTPVDRATYLPCGGGINTYGVTGTPVIDMTTRTLYAESFYVSGGKPAHQVVAISIDNGAMKSGWPVQINSTTTPQFPGPYVEHARGALSLVNGVLYIPYSGLNGDCNGDSETYHGGIVGIDVANPTTIKSWFTSASWGGSWGTSGIASDGTSVFLTTGNTTGAGGTWGGGEAVLRFTSGPSSTPADYFAPHDWQSLDNSDTDLGSSEAIVIDVPGATPSQLLFAGGKGQTAYLINRTNMGHIASSLAGDGVANSVVASGEIKTAFASYTTATATYVVLHADGNGSNCPGGSSGELIALKITATSPPKIQTAWCANSNGSGSPMVTTTDGMSNAIVWIAGAGGTNRLYGYDGDTGATIFNGGGTSELMSGLEHWITLTESGGRFYVGGDGKVFAFH